jgi:23S rRNA-/tRNA-specific pseudouridylate synthase
MTDIRKDSVTFLDVDDGDSGQRLDNFLVRILKGVPKSHIYRILRSGEVRVNKGRIDASYRIQAGDQIRIPPIRLAERPVNDVPPGSFPVVYEDNALLVIDKPAGVAVHGGSGVSFGVIEQLRKAHPDWKYLELVHRLDRETSGLLMLAKKRSALVKLHDMMRANVPDKRYLALGWARGTRATKASSCLCSSSIPPMASVASRWPRATMASLPTPISAWWNALPTSPWWKPICAPAARIRSACTCRPAAARLPVTKNTAILPLIKNWPSAA